MRTTSLLFAAMLAAFASVVSAETLYKLIDKNGKVTYSGEKPKNFDGQVIRIDIDPNANTATLPKPPPASKGGEEGTRRAPTSFGNPARAAAEDRVRMAKEKLEAARKTLQDVRDNPGVDDVQFVGKVGGGARPVPSEEYLARLAQLEGAVKDAEEELRRAEKED
jgi:hypothetical protein